MERLGRQAVELREPLGALDGRLVVVPDAGEDDDARLHGLGIPAGLRRLEPQLGEGGAVLIGSEEEGNPAVADGGGTLAGSVAGAAEPQRDGCRRRFLHVVGASRVGAGPGPAQPGDALVHQVTAAVVIDAGAHVLGLVDAHAQPEDEAPAGEKLERGGLLGHDGGRPQGQLQHARPQHGPGRRHRGHGQCGEGLADGVGPVEVVDRPQGVGPGGLGAAAQLGHLVSATGSTHGTTVAGGEFSLRGGGEDEPECGSRHSTSYRGHTAILRRWPRPDYSVSSVSEGPAAGARRPTHRPGHRGPRGCSAPRRWPARRRR